MISIQVKTLSKKNGVPLGASLDKVMGDFWVIINNVAADPQTYVMSAIPALCQKTQYQCILRFAFRKALA